MRNEIICGDSLKILPTLPRATLVFADPPDNLGLKYDGYVDRNGIYAHWLLQVVSRGITHTPGHFWLSYYYKYQPRVMGCIEPHEIWHQYIWRFNFGQHNKYDCGNNYRPQLRISRPDAPLYPDAIRVKSRRQELGDKRADPRGRVPGDVWEFPRVCGNFKERRSWHPTQHPEALIERIVKFTTQPGDLVVDMFAGTGTVNRVCKRLGRECIGIELSEYYCEKAREDLNGTEEAAES